jgi:hypothetical protein
VAEIRKYNLAFILNFGAGVVGEEILRVPRYGVWSFHHGDNEKYQGDPPCFWEIYNGDIVTGAILQRLTDRPGTSVVLHKGFFRTINQSYFRNMDAVFFGSADWPARVCKDILNGNAAYLFASPMSSAAPTYKAPGNGQMLLFLLKVTRNFLWNQFNSLFRSDQWNVGIVYAPIHKLLTSETLPQIHWFPQEERTLSLADPFAIRQGEKTIVLAEKYDYRSARGFICAMESREDKSFSPPRPVMNLPGHVSYPYLLVHKGDIYCVPGTERELEVNLYKARSFPDEWVKVASLIRGFAAVDPTVFYHEGLWWLLCTDGESGPDSKLFGWYAADLLGPWLPHTANPLKTDVRSSRPAGTPFVHNGQLYRPAQDGSRTYGGAVVINRILRLTPTEFQEEAVAVVRPNPDSPYPDGLHTISAAGDITIIDGKRRVFIHHGFQKALRSKIHRIIRIPFRCPRHETPLCCLTEELEK